MSKKSEIVFVNSSKEVMKVMAGLARAALNASAKVIKKHVRDDVPIRTKHIKNHVAHWTKMNSKEEYGGRPELQVGFYGWQKVRKRGKQPSHSSPWWIEQGTKPHSIPKLTADKPLYDKSTGTFYGWHVDHPGQQETNVLRNSVYDNISEIRAAQEEYLKLLNEEIEKAGCKALFEDVEEDD